jgi:hypothetical protein
MNFPSRYETCNFEVQLGTCCIPSNDAPVQSVSQMLATPVRGVVGRRIAAHLSCTGNFGFVAA